MNPIFPRFCRALLAGSALLLAALPARAEEPSPFQAALHAGYRMGGGLEDETTGEDRDLDEGGSFALALELRYRPGDDRFYQLWYSRQETEIKDAVAAYDVDVEYLHLGGTIPIGDHERAQPYFAAGLGGTRFSSSEPGAHDETRFSGSLAFGVAVPLGERAAFRFEARGYLTVVDSDSAIFCRSDNGTGFCRVIASGSTVVQVEALAGIAIRF
jgi:opacity protein-like surface antigen